MRVVFISSMAGDPWGGSEELWSQAAVRLAHEGHRVAASVTYWPQLSPRVRALVDHGIDLFVRKPERPTPAQRFARKLTHQKSPRVDLIWLQRQAPDMVVISQGGSREGLGWMKFCVETGLPFVTIIQCNAEYWWPQDDQAEAAKTIYRVARKIFFVSRSNLELLERQLGEALPHSAVVWNPYNVSPPATLTWPHANATWKLACVARMEPAAKGQDVLLQVLSQSAWRNRPLEVNFYGAGKSEHTLRRLAALLNLNHVHFRGHVANVAEIWEHNHALVLPSRYEGMPLALVEAMWCGRPAIATNVGGNAELCRDGETGFIAPAPTVEIFAQILERAWSQRHEWQRMGQAARVRAEHLIPQDPVGVFCQQLMECLT